MNGLAGAPAPPVAPRAASSGLESAMVLPMEALSARATGWKLETASCSSAQVRTPSPGTQGKGGAHWGGMAVEVGIGWKWWH